jgi:hypothetical protein
MKHLIAIVVAVLLPLQLSWGVAATYCQHETTPQGAKHFGHHTHVHTDAQQEAKASSGKLMTDVDCSFCHASPAAALPDFDALPSARVQTSVPLSLGNPRHPSAPQRTPDRPQWPRLA